MSEIAELYNRINQLKREKDVVILSHFYMPEALQLLTVEGGIADFVGDSLGLSVEAGKVSAKHILFCGVRFMAETAILVNPEKKVLMPDPSAGCSLAESITAEQVRELKQKYPGVPVMGYVNTRAETKTELDVCCTSRNAVQIARSLDSDTIIFVPDFHMGQNLQQSIAADCGKKLILWDGTCEVHEQFRNDLIHSDEDTEILMHWEVPGDTVNTQLSKRKGMVGSTSDILSYVKQSHSTRFLVASECDLSVSLKKQNSDKEFITPCITCRYMKQNTLANTLRALERLGTSEEDLHVVSLDPETIKRASVPVARMLELS